MTTNITKINDSLFLGKTPDILNRKMELLVDIITPSIKKDAEESLFNRFVRFLGGDGVDMNEGLVNTIKIDKAYLIANPEYDEIVEYVYQLLTDQGFFVSRFNGYIVVNIYEVDTIEPVNTTYAEQIYDNEFARFSNFHSCTFYVKKDEGVKGDFFYHNKGEERSKIKTIGEMFMLRNGNLIYDVEPHSGKGTEINIQILLEEVDEVL